MRLFPKIILILITIFTLIMLVYGVIISIVIRNGMVSEINERGMQAIERIAYMFSDSRWRNNDTLIEAMIDNEMKQQDIFAIIISDPVGVMGKVRTENALVPYNNMKHTKLLLKAESSLTYQVEESGRKVGTIKLYLQYTSINIALFQEIVKLIVQIILIVSLLAVSLSVVLFALVTKPINMISGKIREMAKGEGNLTRLITYNKKDEVAFLVGNFNEFIIKMRTIVQGIQESSRRTIDMKNRLTDMVHVVSDSMSTIVKNIDGIKAEVVHLDSRIRSSTACARDITDCMETQNSCVDGESESVSQSCESVNGMVSSIRNIEQITGLKKISTENLVRTVREGGTKLESTGDVIVQINGHVDEISEMMSMINGIVGQTNMLAMNAAIEAAHSGDSGRGFSVIADEIRKLAESAGSNAKVVEEAIKGIVAKIQSATSSSREMNAAFQEIEREVQGVRAALEEIFASTAEAALGGEEILNAMSALSEYSVKVKNGSLLINENTDKMAASIDEAMKVSVHVMNAMSTISSGTEDITSKLEDFTGIVRKLDETSEKLHNEINKFET